MNVYITTGTFEFLKSIQKKYSSEEMVIMTNVNGALLLHETNGVTQFKEPRKYEVLDSVGSITEEGFVVFNNMAVTDEGRPLFEHNFKNRIKKIEKEPGFIAFRVLRPLSSNTYVILTVWEKELDYLRWKDSTSFTEAHSKSGIDIQPKIFVSAPYISTYTITE